MANGKILIWNPEEVRKVWADSDMLFRYIPIASEKLDGKIYRFAYEGAPNWSEDWDEPDLSYLKPEEREKIVPRLVEFVTWLRQNATVWKVWS